LWKKRQNESLSTRVNILSLSWGSFEGRVGVDESDDDDNQLS
jgi:hypothetical protein